MAGTEMTGRINSDVAETIKAYLDYCSDLVSGVLESKGYSTDRFREISDELIITPKELVGMVDDLQKAYSRI